MASKQPSPIFTGNSIMRVALLVLALTPGLVQAQLRDSIITVSASRMVRVPADKLSMYVGVEGTAETGTDALARVDVKLKNVTDAIQKLGNLVQAERPLSYGVNIAQPQSGYPGIPNTTSYVARAVIRVHVNRLDQVGVVQSAVLAAGASTTTGYAYEAASADSARRARLTEAMAAARADAEVLARAQGMQLGPLVDMTTGSNLGIQQPSYLSFDTRSYSPQAPAPEVTVSANVTMRFRLLR
jgi:uncharacterized protein